MRRREERFLHSNSLSPPVGWLWTAKMGTEAYFLMILWTRNTAEGGFVGENMKSERATLERNATRRIILGRILEVKQAKGMETDTPFKMKAWTTRVIKALAWCKSVFTSKWLEVIRLRTSRRAPLKRGDLMCFTKMHINGFKLLVRTFTILPCFKDDPDLKTM